MRHYFSDRLQAAGSVSTSPERAGLAISRLELPTVVCVGFSHFFSPAEGIFSGAVRTTVSLFDRIERRNEHTTTATQNKQTIKARGSLCLQEEQKQREAYTRCVCEGLVTLSLGRRLCSQPTPPFRQRLVRYVRVLAVVRDRFLAHKATNLELLHVQAK